MNKEELKEQVITEEDIIEVLNNRMNFIDEKTGKYEKTNKVFFKQIASEILSKSKWKIVASGKVIDGMGEYMGEWIIGDKDLLNLFDCYAGKNIDVAVRVKEGKCLESKKVE